MNRAPLCGRTMFDRTPDRPCPTQKKMTAGPSGKISASRRYCCHSRERLPNHPSCRASAPI
ncbi:MAG: hypothetical protein ABSA27_09785, partial [Terriglobales bacterium]